MAGQDRLRWDQVYRDRQDEPYPPPAPLLFEFTPPISDEAEHRALDLAGGVGQNGLWLSAQGYLVDIVDISRVALLRAQAEAARRQLHNINLYPVDLDDVRLDASTYEIACVFRFLKRDLFPQLRACIRPGGRIIYETFNQRYRRLVPEFNPSFLLEVGELAGVFADWRILHNVETNHISRLVAIKP
jgi:SAM-dependent methyltransferase